MKNTLESFSECTGVSNVVEVGRKSVPGGWTTVGETSFSESSFLKGLFKFSKKIFVRKPVA